MIAWAAGNMLWASAAMLLVLAIRRPVAVLFGAGTAYALWLVPALRLVAPPGQWIAGLFGADLPSLPPLVLLNDTAAAAAAPLSQGEPGQWVSILLAVWAGGAALLLVSQSARYRAFLRRLSLSLTSIGSHHGIPVMASDAVDGPLALGLLDRRIVVPADFAVRYSAAERALALEHEAYHHRRRDLLANHLALLILALHWFNPVAWAAFRAFRADQELSCDAAVLRGASPSEREHYARALIKSASRPGLISACPLNHADQLKRRLKMINRHHAGRLRRLGGTAAVALTLAASVGVGTAGAAQEQGERRVDPAKQGNIVIMQRQRGADAAPELRLPVRDGRLVLPDGCPQGEEVANVRESEGDTRTRVLLCDGNGARTPAQMIATLERVRSSLAANTAISPEARQRVERTLEQELQRLRSR